MDRLQMGREVFDREIAVLENIKGQLGDTFLEILEEILNCKGKVILIGMGKSGHVAKKVAASMASLGSCAICLHPGECMHGDLGMIQERDVVILISYSGESDEILRIIPGIHMIGATMIGITSNRESSLARACKMTQVMDGVQEACYMGLAPTSSTTAVMTYGDALAIVAARLKGFGRDDFGRFHPAGSLGKKLITRAVDLMHPLKNTSLITKDATLYDALQAMIETDVDLIVVVNEKNELAGIVTNGDLKRTMESQKDIMANGIAGMVHEYPYFVDDSAMAIDALKIMIKNAIHAIPIVKNNRPIGVIEKREIIKYGIYV